MSEVGVEEKVKGEISLKESKAPPEVKSFFQHVMKIDAEHGDDPAFVQRQDFWFSFFEKIDKAVEGGILTPDQRRFFLATRIAELEKLAERDNLTRLYNQRGFEVRFQEVAALMQNDGKPLTLCLLDIDNFKNVNASLGHDGANEALKSAAQIIRANLGPENFAGRWGGDEFVIVFPGSKGRETTATIEKLNEEIAKVAKFTFSIGVAQSEGVYGLPDLFSRADSAVYQAKGRGKNQIMLWEEGMPERVEKK